MTRGLTPLANRKPKLTPPPSQVTSPVNLLQARVSQEEGSSAEEMSL